MVGVQYFTGNIEGMTEGPCTVVGACQFDARMFILTFGHPGNVQGTFAFSQCRSAVGAAFQFPAIVMHADGFGKGAAAIA